MGIGIRGIGEDGFLEEFLSFDAGIDEAGARGVGGSLGSQDGEEGEGVGDALGMLDGGLGEFLGLVDIALLHGDEGLYIIEGGDVLELIEAVEAGLEAIGAEVGEDGVEFLLGIIVPRREGFSFFLGDGFTGLQTAGVAGAVDGIEEKDEQSEGGESAAADEEEFLAREFLCFLFAAGAAPGFRRGFLFEGLLFGGLGLGGGGKTGLGRSVGDAGTDGDFHLGLGCIRFRFFLFGTHEKRGDAVRFIRPTERLGTTSRGTAIGEKRKEDTLRKCHTESLSQTGGEGSKVGARWKCSYRPVWSFLRCRLTCCTTWAPLGSAIKPLLMKLFKTRAFFLSLFAGSVLLTAGAAKAQNSYYAPGDLVLFFQQEGGANTVYVNLGNTATVFRDATANISNIVNINAQLNQAFGNNWTSMGNIYAGLAGVWGTSNTSVLLQDGDPHRTLYVSQSRDGAGTAGVANSAGYTVNTTGGMTTAAGQIAAANNPFETNYDARAVVSPTSISGIDDYNPFSSPGIQGTAFGSFAGGVQQVSSTGVGSFGTIGAYSNLEFGLDLYRILGRTGISGQVEGDLRQGSYEGTVVVDNAGNVSFVAAVPEPSTWLLFGLGSAWVLYGMRRRKATA